VEFLSIGPGSSTVARVQPDGLFKGAGCCGFIDPGLSAARDGSSH
jgi:hypothetical protein